MGKSDFYIELKTIADIRDFVSKVTKLEYEVDLEQNRYIIDAKSIMGIFALDLLAPIRVMCHTDDPSAFYEEIEKYRVADPEK